VFLLKKFKSNVLLGLLLVALSVILFSLQITYFRASRDTFFYLLQDLAFLPLQILIVTLVLEQILRAREKRDKLRKIKVVMSAFFIEAGSQTIRLLSEYVQNTCQLKELLLMQANWKEEDFKAAFKTLRNFDYDMQSQTGNLMVLRDFLKEKKVFMLGMFENPYILEHDAFTDMLWATFHVSDELESRDTLELLPKTDYVHLSGDMKRAFRFLLVEWLDYMKHLQKEYPYLFSIALRKNPLGDRCSVIIQE